MRLLAILLPVALCYLESSEAWSTAWSTASPLPSFTAFWSSLSLSAADTLFTETSADNTLDPRLLWGIRATSALTSYVGLVTYLDRPKGSLMLEADQYEVRKSSIEGGGLGLFVTCSILPKGTVLGTYPGVVLPLSSESRKLEQYPQCEAYVWRFSDSQQIIDPTDAQGEIQDVCRGGNPNVPFSTSICQLLAPTVPTTLCRINEPPKGKDCNVVTDEDLLERTVTFVLERNVYAGEELFMDYGLTYDRSGYGR